MCGIYLLYNSELTILPNFLQNLKKIQHRGHDSYGVIARINKSLLPSLRFFQNGKIIIPEVINSCEKYNIFLGHLRYKTSGLHSENGGQPIFTKNKLGSFHFVFNGNIPCSEYPGNYTLDTTMIKEFLEKDEHINSWGELLQSFVNTFKRAYSIIIVTDTDKVFLLKDCYGVRPLCFSYSESNQTLEVASESVGISLKNHDKITEVNPGEILEFDLANINVPKVIYKEKELENLYGGKCIFEYIYFLNSETTWNNLPVEKIRNEWAKSLAKTDLEWINSVDKNNYIVIGIPSTGVQPGQAYAKELELNYIQGITKNAKVNRTFILAESERDKVSKKKYIYNKELIQGKHVIIIDDSIVRGVTMRNLVHSIFDNGALGVHIRIISPTITDICKYGIDIPTKEELIANKMSIPQMNDYFGASSLKFLEIDLLMKTIEPFINKSTICSGCFGGGYNDIDIEDLVVNKQKETPQNILNYQNIETKCIIS